MSVRFSLPLLFSLLCLLSLFSPALSVAGPAVNVSTAVINPYGIVYDGVAFLYVSDSATASIVKMTTAGVIVGNFSFTPALSDPRGLAIDTAGNLYVADRTSLRVVKFSPTGATLAVYGPTAPALSFPFGVAVDGNGNIFIADSGSNRVLEISQTGASIGASPSGAVVSPFGVASDVAGNVYVADSGNNRIVKRFANGTFAPIFTSASLIFPEALTVAFNGDIFVADTGNKRVVQFSQTLGVQTNVLTSSTFGPVTGVTLDSFGTLYVCDVSNGRVVKFANATAATPPPSSTSSATSAPLAPTGAPTAAPTGAPISTGAPAPVIGQTIGSGFSMPYGVVFDGSQYLYVSDSATGSVIKMTTAGVIVANFTSNFNMPLTDPRGLGIDRAGTIYVTDHTTSRVIKFTPSGTQVAVLGPINTIGLVNVSVNAPDNSTLSLPFGVSVDPFFNIWIADSGSDRIVEMNQNNQIIGSSPSGLVKSPFGVTTDAVGNVFACDTPRGRIVTRSTNGTWSVFFTGLNFPEALVVDAFGNLFVADTGNQRVVEISSAGVMTQVFRASGPAFGYVTGITLDNQGNMYVVDITNARVVKFTNVTLPTPVIPTSTASLCFITYGLPGTIDYPWSVATTLTFQYTTTLLAAYNAIQIVGGSGTRVFTNKNAVSFSTAVTVSNATDDVIFLTSGSSVVDLSGLSLSLASPTQLPGAGSSNLTSLVTLFRNGTGAFFEGASAQVDPQGQAFLSNLPGFTNLTIGAGNVNNLAVIYSTCTAPVTFSNGQRPFSQPSASNGGNRIQYSYFLTDNATYSVSTSLSLVASTGFATAKDQLGNNYQTIIAINGTRTYTYFLNFTTPGSNTTLGPNITQGATLVSNVTGIIANTTDRFYPFAFLQSAPGVYPTINVAPFLDASGLTFGISPAAPLNGNPVGVGPSVTQETVAVQTVNGVQTLLSEYQAVIQPVAAFEQQTYTFSTR